MTHSLTRKMSDTFSENEKGFENTTETSQCTVSAPAKLLIPTL